MTSEEAKDALTERVANSNFERVLKFDCGQDGVLVINRHELSTEDAEAECTIAITLEDLHSLVKGELNPVAGFMQGKLRIDGDMGVAMQLQNLLS